MNLSEPLSYSFKTTPYAHQLAAFARSAEREFFALTMEQGTGKTKVIIDTAAHLYNTGHIDSLLIIAPNGVHRNWIQLEIPKHLPDYIVTTPAAWASTPNKAQAQAYQALYTDAAHHTLRILAINVEALAVARVVKEAKLFLNTSRGALTVIDESTTIKSPSAIRTKNILSLRPLTHYRRILTGTPVTQSPLDIFTQYSFLDEDILKTQSFAVFRARYAELMEANHPLIQHILRTTNARRAPILIATDKAGRPIYKNLDELKSLTDPHTLRVLKRDCLDLPPKIYVRRPVFLAPAQEKAYNDLRRRLKHGLQAGEEQLAGAPLTKLTAVMYLQRILCGTLPAPMTPDNRNQPLFTAPQHNPRIQALLAELEETDEQAIIWCRFTDDIISVAAALKKAYGDTQVVTYYGEVSSTDRDAAVARFQSGDARFFVGNPQAGGFGLTLTAAGQVHYYSNSFKLEERLQSEDRAHRIGQTKTVRYVDYEVANTVDTKILQALSDKKNVADVITGDSFEEWL